MTERTSQPGVSFRGCLFAVAAPLAGSEPGKAQLGSAWRTIKNKNKNEIMWRGRVSRLSQGTESHFRIVKLVIAFPLLQPQSHAKVLPDSCPCFFLSRPSPAHYRLPLLSATGIRPAFTFHSCNRTQHQQSWHKKAAKNFLSDRAEPQVCLRPEEGDQICQRVAPEKKSFDLQIQPRDRLPFSPFLFSFFPLRNVGPDGE